MILRSANIFQVPMKLTGSDNASEAFLSCKRRPRTKKGSVSQLQGASYEKDLSPKSMADKHNLSDLEWTNHISECPVYRPTNEEFEDPLTYLLKISREASKYGICKIVSPLKASVPASEVLRDFKFPTYVQPLRLAAWDWKDKVAFSIGERKHNYHTFKRMADERYVCLFPNSTHLLPDHLEKEFWRQMSSGKEETVEYAVNVDGTAFSSDPSDQLGASKWNLKSLPKLPNSILRFVEHDIPGITYPMLYIGMLYSMFAWHVEDHYLYSINYHHTGAPKTWYGVPGHAALQLEKVVVDHVYAHHILSTSDEDGASKEMAEKTTMFPPSILLKHGVPVYRAVQMPGEFVITFPRAYHAGFSNGFNCGEAVNFAIGDWFPFGAIAGSRYALLGTMAILPYEELLCQEANFVSKQEGMDKSSAEESISDHAVKISFVRHMRCFNHALWRLKNNVRNLRASTQLLPNLHGTVICSTCRQDCYLAFLECNCCKRLQCLLHDIETLDCQCGGKHIVFIRDDIWNIEYTAQKLEEEVMLKVVQQEKGYGNISGQQPDIISCVKSQYIPCIKNEDASTSVDFAVVAAPNMSRRDGGGFDVVENTIRGNLIMEGLLPCTGGGIKRKRTSCKVQKTPARLTTSKSEVPLSV